ncbi:hypothetical protein RP20_CCG007437 [Aedes albopictus]|nr:hypothetical protein RP20_CCG007437 [Aedes albopictus]
MVQYGRKCMLCKNTRKREPGCRLFKFPARGSPMWHRWLEACGLREADIDVRSREPPRLCQRHFQKKDFLTRQLTGMAVPSVFPVTVYTEVIEAVYQPEEQGPIEYGEIIVEESVGNEENDDTSRNGDLRDIEVISSVGDSGHICTIEEHQTLTEDLQNERNRVECLSRELVEKDRIIREQFELLKQLGVQVVTVSEPNQK